MQVEYEGMANDYTVTPVDDPEGIWSFCKFIMGPAKAAIFSRPEFAHTSEQHIVCGNKDFNGYPDSPIAAGTIGIWFTVVESRLNEVQGVLEDIACRKTADCTSAVLRGRLCAGVATSWRHSPRLPYTHPGSLAAALWPVRSRLPGVATDPRSLHPHRGRGTAARPHITLGIGEPISLLIVRRGIEDALKTQLKLANPNQPASYASSVSVVFVSESMAQIDGAYMMPVANFTTTDGQCFDANGNFLGVEIRPGFTAAVAKQRQMTPEVRP